METISISAPAKSMEAGRMDNFFMSVLTTASSMETSSKSTSYSVSSNSTSLLSPLVAFPWESASTSIVLYPLSARNAARFTAVVVFPTPPFWLMILMIFPIAYILSQIVHIIIP